MFACILDGREESGHFLYFPAQLGQHPLCIFWFCLFLFSVSFAGGAQEQTVLASHSFESK